MKRDIQHNGGVVMLNVIYAECCYCLTSQKLIILSVIMLSAVMLHVVMPSVTEPL